MAIISVRTHSEYWEAYQGNKADLFDDTQEWRTKSFGANMVPCSKRLNLVLCLSGLYRTKRFDVIHEIYQTLLKAYSLPQTDNGEYPFLLLWILENMHNGHYEDLYHLYCTLANYYYDKRLLREAACYLQEEHKIHQELLNEATSLFGYEQDTGKALYAYAYSLHLTILNELLDFDESRRLQEECFSLGYFSSSPEKERNSLLAFSWFRLEAEIAEHKKKGTIPDVQSDLIILEQLSSEHAATGYKYLGDLYYKAKDYRSAIDCYEKALSLWPIVYAAATKLSWAKNKLAAETKKEKK